MSNYQCPMIQKIFNHNKNNNNLSQPYDKIQECRHISRGLDMLFIAIGKGNINEQIKAHISSVICQINAIIKISLVKKDIYIYKLFESNLRSHIHLSNAVYNDSFLIWVYDWYKKTGRIDKGYDVEIDPLYIVNHLQELLLAYDDTNLIIEAHIDSVISQIGALSKLIKDPMQLQDIFYKQLDICIKDNYNSLCTI